MRVLKINAFYFLNIYKKIWICLCLRHSILQVYFNSIKQFRFFWRNLWQFKSLIENSDCIIQIIDSFVFGISIFCVCMLCCFILIYIFFEIKNSLYSIYKKSPCCNSISRQMCSFSKSIRNWIYKIIESKHKLFLILFIHLSVLNLNLNLKPKCLRNEIGY